MDGMFDARQHGRRKAPRTDQLEVLVKVLVNGKAWEYEAVCSP